MERARGELETALNRGSKPSNICDAIRVMSLQMGTQPPELTILEIGELSEERFRGIFKVTYNGDARIVLQTKVQANPLNLGPTQCTIPAVGPTIAAADAPLIVPLELQISQFRIRGIFVLIVSLQRGVTISFKNDPLESVQINSTFDNVPSIRHHLQAEIEQRIATLIREDLPLTVHHLSINAIKELADRIPVPFKPPLPLGHFRRRQSSTAPSEGRGDTSSITPSRANSPANSTTTSLPSATGVTFDEIYYFRRNSVIHRTISKYSICDPLTEPTIKGMRRRASTLVEDLSGIMERIPIFGEEAKEALDRWSQMNTTNLEEDDDTLPKGLKDPILFQSSKFGSQTLVINSGSMQLNLPKETMEGLSGTSDKVLRRPSVYKAVRASLDTFGDGSTDDGEQTMLLDPDEFRSVDSLAIRPRVVIGSSISSTYRMPILGAATLQKAVHRTSLPGKLQILRVLHENTTPFDFSTDRHIVHRSSPHSRE